MDFAPTAVAHTVSPAVASLLEPSVYSPARALELAALAEQCGRWEDVCDVASVMAERACAAGEVLPPASRNVLAVGFKSALSSFRGTLKMLGLVAQHETAEANLAAVAAYARRMEAGVLRLAERVLALAAEGQGALCEDVLAASAPGSPPARAAAEAGVFFYKLAGDYARYVSECHTVPFVVARHSDLALSFYSKARGVASAYLHPAHPAAVGVVLNFSVFLFEIRRCEEEAYELAQAVLEEAALALQPEAGAPDAPVPHEPEYPALTAQERADSSAVQGLIKENLLMWAQVLEIAKGAAVRR